MVKSLSPTRWLLLMVVFSVVLASCAPTALEPAVVEPADTQAAAPEDLPEDAAETAPEPVGMGGFTVTDAMGRTIEFESPPQRVVQAGKAAIMLVDAIYLFPDTLDRMVAMPEVYQGTGNFSSVIDPDFEEKTKFTGDVGPEQIAATQPDVVLLKSFMQESLGKPLEELGIPVVYLEFETPEQYQRDLMTLGELFQDRETAERLVAYYQAGVERVAEPLAGLADSEKPRVLVLYYNDSDGEAAFNVPPLGWMQTILVETAGGIPVWKDTRLGNGWSKVNFEQISAWDPDQVYLISYWSNADEVVAGLKENPDWQALRAVQEEQIYSFPADYYSWDQPDVRWLLGLNWLATKIHPEVFPDLDILQVTRDFYRDLYGLDDAAFETHIAPYLRGDLP